MPGVWQHVDARRTPNRKTPKATAEGDPEPLSEILGEVRSREGQYKKQNRTETAHLGHGSDLPRLTCEL